MDRLIAANTVAVGQGDTAPATGTPGQATDGNPATNTPATQWPAYQYNAISEEILAVIEAAGITFDKTKNDQLLSAIRDSGLFTRKRLIADTTFYVAATGNDSTGDGTSGTPWLTIQHAVDVIRQQYDCNGFVPTIQVADSVTSYSGAKIGALVGTSSNPAIAQFIIKGNTASPSNVKITDAYCFLVTAGSVLIEGFQLKGTSNLSQNIGASVSGFIKHQNNIFDASSGVHIDSNAGGTIEAIGNYSIIGGAIAHIATIQAGVIYSQNISITLTGTPAFSHAFIESDHCGIIFCDGSTFIGSSTGARYLVTTNGVIDTDGSGASYLPGSAAGSATTGGQYV